MPPAHPPDDRKLFRLRVALWRLRTVGAGRLFARSLRRMSNPAWHLTHVLWLVGCVSPTPPPPATPTTPPASAWTAVAPGVEQRTYQLSFFTRVAAVRVDPTLVQFRSHYRPGDPLFAHEWADTLDEPLVVFNTNFFDFANNITGVLFADGQRFGSDPYRRRGGTFYVDSGTPGIQSNSLAPYAGETYDQAVQAFPMLVTGGSRSYFDNRADRSARRTVVALDDQGRVIVFVTSFGGTTLMETAIWLDDLDLNIVDALNLDGGGSSLLVTGGAVPDRVASFDPVPAVMAVYSR